MWIIIGLGNPGEEYTKTRHNIGFRCLNEVARRVGVDFDTKRAKARVAETTIGGQRVVLAKPFTFMNLSGQAVVGLCQWYKADPEREVLVVYDDLDLPFGTLRIRERGSAGTHNGMRSIVGLLGKPTFARLRVGIGNVPPQWDTAKYVLGRFTKEEEEQVPGICGRAADAIDVVVREGVTAAMNRYNPAEGKKQRPTEPSA